MHARFVRTEWENDARTIATLYFRPDKPYYFTAGQYASITMHHDNADSRGVTRTMTLSSSPAEKLLAFTTRLSGPGSSYKQALSDLKPGEAVSINDPMGDMVLPLDSSIPLVFVAGGIGIASYVSMLHWLTEQHDKRDITLLYGVRDITDIIFQKQFDNYAAAHTITRILYTTDNKADRLDWPGSILKSRITSLDITTHIKPDSQIYLSGTEAMVEQLRHELEHKHKIAQYQIVFDFFDGYTTI